MRGCSVLTRPSIISGTPVTSGTLTTERPARVRARAVPPVEMSSKPRAASPRPMSTIAVLSETLMRALGIIRKVKYHLRDAGRAWRRTRKAAHAAFFFGLRQRVQGFGSMTERKARVTASRNKNDAHHRQGQVVQQRQGLWVHRTGRRQRRLRPLL